MTLIQSSRNAHASKPKMVAAVQETATGGSPTQNELTQTLRTLVQELTAFRERRKAFNVQEVMCFRCKKKGHFKRNCPEQDKPKEEKKEPTLN